MYLLPQASKLSSRSDDWEVGVRGHGLVRWVRRVIKGRSRRQIYWVLTHRRHITKNAAAGAVKRTHGGPLEGVAVQQLEKCSLEKLELLPVHFGEAVPLPGKVLPIHPLDLIHDLHACMHAIQISNFQAKQPIL